MTELMPDVLLDEYETLIADLGEDATDEQIVTALISRHSWTEEGARAILTLAQTYGSSILRNALALASAMHVEDGSSGL